VKLTAFIEYELEDGNKVYNLYTEKLKGVVETQAIPEGYVSTCVQYTVKLKNKEEKNDPQTKLKEEGISSVVYYTKSMHKQGAFAEYIYDDNDFEVTNDLCNRVLSLTMHSYLTEEDVESIIKEIIE
jgi:dTDP-4-amino-4,6-dideoxygalactose transaminase